MKLRTELLPNYYSLKQNIEKDIYVYKFSGGSVHDGLGIFDTMQHVKPDIHTVCVGLAASMGAFYWPLEPKGKGVALDIQE